MKVTGMAHFVSYSKDKKRAEIVNENGVTRHVFLESDGKYHWYLKDEKGQTLIHEFYIV